MIVLLFVPWKETALKDIEALGPCMRPKPEAAPPLGHLILQSVWSVVLEHVWNLRCTRAAVTVAPIVRRVQIDSRQAQGGKERALEPRRRLPPPIACVVLLPRHVRLVRVRGEAILVVNTFFGMGLPFALFVFGLGRGGRL